MLDNVYVVVYRDIYSKDELTMCSCDDQQVLVGIYTDELTARAAKLAVADKFGVDYPCEVLVVPLNTLAYFGHSTTL